MTIEDADKLGAATKLYWHISQLYRDRSDGTSSMTVKQAISRLETIIQSTMPNHKLYIRAQQLQESIVKVSQTRTAEKAAEAAAQANMETYNNAG